MKLFHQALPALLAALCTLQAAQPPRAGGELRLALQSEPKTLDPLRATDESSELLGYLTGGVLIRQNRQSQVIEPALATSWKLAGNGRSLSFELRRGIAFSDGSPFDSADVCFTFKRLMDPKLEAPASDALGIEKGPTECVARGPYLVSLRFAAPLVSAELVMDGIPIQSSRSTRGQSAVLGPFVISEHKPGVHILLTRNPRYWKKDENGRALPYLDSIRLEIQRNRDLELMRYRRGELALVNNLDPESFERLKNDAAAGTRDLGISVDTEQLWFNQTPSSPAPAHKKAWFTSTEFRLAVSEAVRRADLVRVVYRNHASPAAGPVSPANRYWANSRLLPLEASPARALDRLRKAGFTFSGGVLKDSGGHPVEFSIITNAGNKSRERMASLIQQDLAAVGMRVHVTPLDFPSLIDRIAKSFDYEACLLGLVNFDLDPSSMMNVWVSSSGQHQWNPNQKTPGTPWEAEMDRLMAAQISDLSPARRKAAYDRVQEIVYRQAPFIYLVYRHALVAVSPALGNVSPAILRPQTLWNAERIYIAEPQLLAGR
jgi:peptide/nickel transport system substrate-binding protein